MKGLELSRRYYQEVGRPALERECPELLPCICVGLVGEGSECLGYDDELSQDHDWGPGFCLWLTSENMKRCGEKVRAIYADLPKEWMGYARLREDPMSVGRIGVLCIEDFYARFLDRTTPPKSVTDWLTIPDHALNVCTNGEIFEDNAGIFSAFRKELLCYYPEDVRRKRLAARCALAAQAGQYNLPRCLQRGERVAAMQAQAEFIDHAQAALFFLERRYRPFYKWSHRALLELPRFGKEAGMWFDQMVRCPLEESVAYVELLSALIIRALKVENLSEGNDDFLISHAKTIQLSIKDSVIRDLPLISFA